MRIISVVCLFGLVSCSAEPRSSDDQPPGESDSGFEPPVLINPESPVAYPVDLFEREVEASVVLRLFVTEEGLIEPESTLVAESSGYPALDAAALSGVAEMMFAPAQRDGIPVATLFLQPVHFRHPARAASGERP